METIRLFRPVNQIELDLIQESGNKKFPPRLPEQPIFYPVMNIEYARMITVNWNVPAYGKGYVVGFDVNSEYVKKFEVQNVGGKDIDELWIPAEELEEFNNNIVGEIELLETHPV